MSQLLTRVDTACHHNRLRSILTDPREIIKNQAANRYRLEAGSRGFATAETDTRLLRYLCPVHQRLS